MYAIRSYYAGCRVALNVVIIGSAIRALRNWRTSLTRRRSQGKINGSDFLRLSQIQLVVPGLILENLSIDRHIVGFPISQNLLKIRDINEPITSPASFLPGLRLLDCWVV